MRKLKVDWRRGPASISHGSGFDGLRNRPQQQKQQKVCGHSRRAVNWLAINELGLRMRVGALNGLLFIVVLGARIDSRLAQRTSQASTLTVRLPIAGNP